MRFVSPSTIIPTWSLHRASRLHCSLIFLNNPRESSAFAVEIADVHRFCFTPSFHKKCYMFVPHQLSKKNLGLYIRQRYTRLHSTISHGCHVRITDDRILNVKGFVLSYSQKQRKHRQYQQMSVTRNLCNRKADIVVSVQKAFVKCF